MFFQQPAGDEVVILVSEDEGKVAKIQPINCWKVWDAFLKSEQHVQVFKEAKGHHNGRLWNIRWHHRHPMMALI